MCVRGGGGWQSVSLSTLGKPGTEFDFEGTGGPARSATASAAGGDSAGDSDGAGDGGAAAAAEAKIARLEQLRRELEETGKRVNKKVIGMYERSARGWDGWGQGKGAGEREGRRTWAGMTPQESCVLPLPHLL